ncbi:hypothetical protein CP97_14685 [Aurantiacibacter atlanticus]|uniref:DUF2933 domain-containing protein n=1 Tax=Aurantiacibacter atlanticus TaxID=1648404 RepID=A0A161I448_9SPHN|nr:hypothetical protein CP97_14685 [Aurantiacibacter atlanticus]
MFIIAAGFLLLFEHRAHIPGDYYLLGLILAFCVGIHLFMHGGHGQHGGHGGGHGAHGPRSADHGAHDKATVTGATNRSSRAADGRSSANDKGGR